MDILAFIYHYVFVFLAILSVVVFVHEGGHYLVARWNGVRVEVFSIGFGPELFGWNDKRGTRWRVSALPLGGYVKMFGDADPASMTGDGRTMTEAERRVAFVHKNVWQRMAIVAAGPGANFVFGIVMLAAVFMVMGQPRTAPVVGSVIENSAAAEAGLAPGDRILTAGGSSIDTFQDLQQVVRLRLGEPLALLVLRDGREVALTANPRITEMTDMFGNVRKVPVLGIGAAADSTEVVQHGPGSALVEAVRETGGMVSATLEGLGQMITGVRPADELGGPLRIAKEAGQASQLGFATIVMITILLSINLGLINLFPIPLLDGGHLVFYAVEAVRGRPLGERAQEYGFRIGLFVVLALMIFATSNDLVDLKVWEMIKGVAS